MTDVFISYAREDAGRIEKLAAALERAGVSVWWDRHIAGGSEFVKETDAELKAAKAVVVAWSIASVGSNWVADEAQVGRDAGRLVPISLDGAEAPLGFRQFQTIDFSRWTGREAAPVRELVAAIARKIEAPSPSTAAPVKASWTDKVLKPHPLVAIGAAALALIIAMLFIFRALPFGTPPSAAPHGEAEVTAINEGPHPEELSAQSDESVSKDETTGGAPNARSIAVLPFVNMSSDPEQEFFSDGISEEILSALTKVEALRVVGRTSSFSFKGKNADLRAIGEALGVAHVLEGSVRKQGERVRVTAQLVKAADGFHLWSETFDREIGDIFAVQDEIARAVAGELQVILAEGAAPLVRKATDDPEAYSLFLQGRALLSRRFGDSLPNAVKLFQQAIARDAEFARAYSGLAATYVVLDNYVAAADAEASAKAARDYAAKALALDDSLAEPHAVIGYDHLKGRDYTGMRQSYDAAVARDPADHTAVLWSGIGQVFVGDLDAARESFDRLLAIDPVWPLIYAWRAYVAVGEGDLDRGEELARRGLALGHPGGHIGLVEAAAARGDAATATQQLISIYRAGGFVSADFTPAEIGVLASGAFGGAGQRTTAMEIVNAHLASGGPVDPLIPYVLLHMGEAERALEAFGRGPTRLDQVFYFGLWGPSGREVRQHKDFPAFAKKVGLLDYWKAYDWPDLCRPTPHRGPDAFECD